MLILILLLAGFAMHVAGMTYLDRNQYNPNHRPFAKKSMLTILIAGEVCLVMGGYMFIKTVVCDGACF